MKSFFKGASTIVVILSLSLSFSCKEEKTELTFKLIERNSYFMDSYNGISVYRDNTTRKPMTGHFLVGNKLKKWEEFKLNEGILNGDYIVFHDNGEKFSCSSYLNGKLNGDDKTFYLSGALKNVKTYKNGNRYGKSISYFESGQIQNESRIENEKAVESISYDIIGNILSQMFIKDGKTITQNIKNGKVFSEHISSNYDNFEAIKFYNEDGSLKVYLRMLDQGDNHYLVELDGNGEEIKRIDIKANPQEFLKYKQFFVDL